MTKTLSKSPKTATRNRRRRPPEIAEPQRGHQPKDRRTTSDNKLRPLTPTRCLTNPACNGAGTPQTKTTNTLKTTRGFKKPVGSGT
jgi:hypothetical protein